MPRHQIPACLCSVRLSTHAYSGLHEVNLLPKRSAEGPQASGVHYNLVHYGSEKLPGVMRSHLPVSLFQSGKRPRKPLGMAFIPQGCVSHWDKALEDILSLGWNRARAVPAGSLSQDGTFPALPAGIVRSTDETEVSVHAYLGP